MERPPYLLQHAENPVNWHPWRQEVFEEAKHSDKPIFLSIGYSTCHWCHVMAHEPFEDNTVAQVINAAFLPIKVDRTISSSLLSFIGGIFGGSMKP